MKSIAMKNLLVSLSMLGAASSAAVAAEPGPACAPIIKAMMRTLQVDHSTLTEGKGQKLNGITAGGVNYLQFDNTWKVSPISPKDNQTRSDENMRNAKSYVCQSLPDSRVDGTPVANFHTHTENGDVVVDSTISISKVSGLLVSVENVLVSDNNNKSDYISRYSYTGIHAPPVGK